MEKAKVHAKYRRPFQHYGSDIITRIISLVIDEQRLVLRHEYVMDCRGSHYGQEEEYVSLVTDPQQRRHFLAKYLGSEQVSDELVTALTKSRRKMVFRYGDIYRLAKNRPWRENAYEHTHIVLGWNH